MPWHEGVTESGAGRVRRAWLLSPAIATGVFFVAQFFVATLPEKSRESVNAAATAEAHQAMPVKVHVVTKIRSLEESSRELASVPTSEREMLELFKRQGCVVFSAHEVDTVGTLEAHFDAEEVGIITADHKLRPARLVRR